MAPLAVSAVPNIRIHGGFNPGEVYLHDSTPLLEREVHGKTSHSFRRPIFSQMLLSWVRFLHEHQVIILILNLGSEYKTYPAVQKGLLD